MFSWEFNMCDITFNEKLLLVGSTVNFLTNLNTET